MSKMLPTTIRSLGQRFYYDNAGLFVMAFFAFFGFLRAEEHLALAQTISHSNYLLILTTLIYSLYTAGTLVYIRKSLRLSENRFLWSIGELPILEQISILVFNQFFMNLPAAAHGILVVYFLIVSNNVSTWFLIAYLLLSHVIPIWSVKSLLTSPYQIRQKKSLLGSLTLNLHKPPWSWNLIYSLEKSPAYCLLGKPISLLILNGFIWISQVEKYPVVWMYLGTLVCIFANAPLIFQFYQFESEKFSLNKNIPWNAWTHLTRIGIYITVSCSAELLVLILNYPKTYSLIELLSLISLILSANLTIYAFLAMLNFDQEKFYKRCFWSFLILFAIILGGVPASLISLIGLSITLWLYRSYYKLFIH